MTFTKHTPPSDTTTPTPNRRTPTSGTQQFIDHLRTSYPNLKTPFKHLEPLQQLSNKLAEAEAYFKAGRWYMCRWKCNEIIKVEGSHAIQARAFMLLARPGITEAAGDRSFYAESAVDSWTKVINREGTSRFPVDEARRLQREARRMLEEADAIVEKAAVSSVEGGGGSDTSTSSMSL